MKSIQYECFQIRKIIIEWQTQAILVCKQRNEHDTSAWTPYISTPPPHSKKRRPSMFIKL
jgi:hypothetical protein